MMNYTKLYSRISKNKKNIKKMLEKSVEKIDRYQESLFNLFTVLGLKSSKFDGFIIQDGNFNEGFLDDININTFFKKKLVSGNDKSDLTLINHSTKEMIVCSSKNKKKLTSNDLDISQIKDVFNKHYVIKEYKLIFCFVVKDKKQIKRIIKNSKKSSKYLVEVLEDNSTIIIDWNDLNIFYDDFYIKYKNKKSFDILSNKKTLNLRFHQKLSVNRTIKLLSYNDKILWGHIPRSGKSYIMAGTILRDSNNKDRCNYLIITSVPNETIPQYFDIFNNYSGFEGINCFRLGSKKKPKLHNKNIIICSIQFLYNKKITWLHKLDIDLTICDESHHGLTAKLSSEQLKYHGDTKFIYMTATYSKPSQHFNISKECHILWDFEDINLCKNIDEKDSYLKLIQKYNCKKLINLYGKNNIKNTYMKFPELHILTTNFKDKIFNDILNMDEHGYSIQSLLLLKNNKDTVFNNFMKPDELLEFCYYIFGKKSKSEVSIPSISIMSRIKNITDIKNSRFISELKPLVILCFLPCGGNSMAIDKVSECFSNFLEKHLDNFDYQFDTVIINSKTTNDPKELIDKKINTTNKKIILVLSGRQCSMGVTIPLCDIVMLFNDTQSLDMIQQMSFRSMSESPGKTCGFLVDLNVRRVSNLVVDYATKLYPSRSIKEGILKVYESRLVNINSDLNDVMKTTRDGKNKYLVNLRNNIYKIWCENPYSNIKGILNELNILNTDYPSHIQLLINELNIECKKSKKVIKEKNIKDGVKVSKLNSKSNEENSNEENSNEETVEKKVDFKIIVKFFIPLICVLSIECKKYDFNEILFFIKENKKLNSLLIEHLNGCFNNINIYTNIMNILDKTDLINNDEIKRVTKIIKQLFSENKYNRKELSKLFDRYLIPQESEKKNNAEVSTPHELRQEMLDKIPINFWKSVKKVFEPCTGKGGFIIDIIDRFMIGLKDSISDEKERYRIIIEECLYFSDINPTNIFICKLLIDPYNEYKYNFNEGNTLELDIKEKWNINGFDAIIGNPPYQAVSENGTSKGGGNNLYTKFIYYADKNLLQNGYLLFINPPTYFGPGRSNNKNDMSLRKDILDKYYYHHINLEECAKHFNVGSKFIYYLIQKDKNNSNNDKLEIICKYNKNIYKTTLNQKLLVRDYIPYLLTNKCLDILDKIIHNTSHKLKIFHSPDNRSDKNHVLKKEKKETNEEYKKRAIKENFVYPMQATSVQIVYSSKKCKNQNDKKILMSRSGYLKPFYDDGIIGIGGDCFACLVSSKEEAYKIIDLLNSKLYKFYIETNKWSGFHNKEVLQDLPNIINDIEVINDNNINTYFNLSDKEIKLIEENV